MKTDAGWTNKKKLIALLGAIGVIAIVIVVAILLANGSNKVDTAAEEAQPTESAETVDATETPDPDRAPVREASITLGAAPVENGIRARAGDNPDGLIVGTLEGKEYWSTNKQAGGDRTLYLYMNVDDDYLYDNKDMDVLVTVEYFDEGSGTITLQYDAQGDESAAFKDAPLFAYRNSGQWKTTVFVLADAKFANRANGDDFRLGVEGGGAAADNPEVRIASVKVKKQAKVDPLTQNKVIQTEFSSEDVVIADFNVMDYGAAADGVTDDTAAVQSALAAAGGSGGGVVFMPAGRYRFDDTLFVPTGVTLRGDRSHTWTGGAVEGTILEVYGGRGEEGGDSFISLRQASGVTNLSIWYPEQSIGQPVAYPWTIEQMSGDSATVEKVTLVNSYNGIKIGPQWNELHYVKQVYGTVLNTGIFLDFTTDIGRLEQVGLSPEYWANSGLPGSPSPEAAFAYTTQNAEGIVMGRSDWEYMSDIRLSGFKTGMRVTTRTDSTETANAQFYRIDIDNSNVALKIEGVNDYGLLITDSSFRANVGPDPIAVYATEGFRAIVQFNTVTIGGLTQNAVVNEGRGVLSFENSVIGDWNPEEGYAIMAKDGALILGGTKFALPEGHVRLEGNARALKSLNSGRDGKLAVDDQSTGADVSVSFDSQYELRPLPKVERTDAPEQPRPATDLLFNVAEEPYEADRSGERDASAAVKKALADADAAGGGTVYFPAGRYLVSEPLVVPTGVEIRGSWDVPHHTIGGGSVIFTNHGENNENAEPFIVLEAYAGIRGINIYYDKQNWEAIKPYGWTIQGRGHGVYAIDTTLPVSYMGIDFGTYDTSGHYIDYVAGSPLKEGIYIGGGAKDGFVRNVQFNPHYSARSNYPGRPMDNQFDLVWEYQKENLDAFRVGHVRNQTIFNTFVYGSLNGIHFEEQNGNGPEAIIIGHGTDGSKRGVFLEGAGPGGLQFINTELVSMSSTDKVYVVVGENFNSDAIFYNTSMWGDPSRSVDTRGGKLVMQQANFVRMGFRAFNSAGGDISLYNSYFLESGNRTHVFAGENVTRMILSNNLYNGPFGLEDKAASSVVRGTDLAGR